METSCTAVTDNRLTISSSNTLHWSVVDTILCGLIGFLDSVLLPVVFKFNGVDVRVELTVEHFLPHCASYTNARDDVFCVTVTSVSELFSKVASHSIIDFIKEI